MITDIIARNNETRKAGSIDFDTEGFYQQFPDQKTCIGYLEKVRWQIKPRCVKCESIDLRRVFEGHRLVAYRFACRRCHTSFNVCSGTIFCTTRVPFQKWFMAIMIMLENQDVSVRTLAKMCGLDKRTSWYLLSRLRLEMNERPEDTGSFEDFIHGCFHNPKLKNGDKRRVYVTEKGGNTWRVKK